LKDISVCKIDNGNKLLDICTQQCKYKYLIHSNLVFGGIKIEIFEIITSVYDFVADDSKGMFF
jgi:hypothetical protein